ncbi:MAG: hypothetical protein CVV64_11000 [Candidatus Wallbacteria bacterium HGW-Wallbacteria-1]|jgi:hypothetical protein|uniref:SLH domain-containing protein n=1 Tax=Candidatus Wallbacteria bacterium HGW-Wallbacteria-1 TaxID=2013854 RepID=A0A2N1PPI5_9BACT|nr:MAG: hypothetical protein CVV64_11000 [Candidatus Wallbacteria bacterium HGW-Wallbacteria-1]
MRILALAVFAIFFLSMAAQAAPFSDVKASHWAYDAISKLSARGYVEGYKDGTFRGEKNLTRYEVAMVISRLIDRFRGMSGIAPEDLRTLEKLTVEFSDELALLGVKVTALEDEMKSVRSELANMKNLGNNGKISISGDLGIYFENFEYERDTIDNNFAPYVNLGINFSMNIDENVSAFVRFMRDDIPLENLGATNQGTIDEAYISINDFFHFGDLRVGRQWMNLGHSIVLDDKMDGLKFSKTMDRVALTMFAFSTRNANGNLNSQWDGNASGTNNYYMLSDSRNFRTAGGAADFNAANTGAGLNLINNLATPLAAFIPGGAAANPITLYTTPYAYSMPNDTHTGSTIATTPDNKWNSHTGIALFGGYGIAGGELAPIRTPATAAATRNFTAYNYVAPANTLDSANTDTQVAAALTRDWDVQSAAGLDSWGLNIAVDFGGHSLAGYYMQRDFDRFDPYTQLGDPWAAMVDYNNDGIVDIDANGRDLSPSANATYWGITLDGNILRNLDYFFEYVTFDPDINNIGVNPLTGDAVNAANTGWNGNNLDSGNAWILGLDWDIAEDMNLIVQYGVGDEEFIPASIFETKGLNGMYGRMNDSFVGGPVGGDVYGTNSLTGIKDLLIKFSVNFNEKTSGFVKYEIARDNDNSAVRLIAGDPMVTGHPAMDYKMISLYFKHIYRPNTALSLGYDYLKYDNDAVNDALFSGNRAFNSDDVNGGGWQRISANVEISF